MYESSFKCEETMGTLKSYEKRKVSGRRKS